MSAVSGLAASIRSSIDSETFDLAGQNVNTITTTFTSAFTEPLPLDHMIRLTFVTGAGKLGRQRYDEGAAKAVTSTLRGLGYEDDKGASCVVECGGSFKMQHDTGKNLKTVVVFPKITGGVKKDGNEQADVTDGVSRIEIDDADLPPALRQNSPENMCALASASVFQRMLPSRCPSWTQKKGCHQALLAVQALIKSFEDNLLQGTALTELEQEFYDSVSADDLAAKEAFAKKEMADQVESGKITKMEREFLLKQVTEKLETLQKELHQAEKDKKPKKAEKLREMLKKAEARQKRLEDITPQPPHKLKHDPEISKLRIELRPLLKLEEGAKGRLLSVKETTALGRKDEILDEIDQLERRSRGWFEDDEAFMDRVEANRAIYKAREKSRSGAGKKTFSATAAGAGRKTTTTTSWVTPAAAKKKAPSRGPAKKPAASGMFAAMMDSDSDSD